MPGIHTSESHLHFPMFVTPDVQEVLAVKKNQLLTSNGQVYAEKQAHIWPLIAPEREEHFRTFIKEYEHVRQAEGRGAVSADFYRNLPFQDLTGNDTNNWKIRAKTYSVFLKSVLKPESRKLARPLRMIDLGAGNGWLSNRLAAQGHQAAAVDLLVNTLDGLGACAHYETEFECVQAEFESLPFADAHADMVVFNASLHYSENFETTLKEAIRVLSETGCIVVLDSPIYKDAASGKAMVREREDAFEQKFGFRSDALQSEHFLTFDRLRELGKNLGLSWQFIRPFYGWKWHLKPLLAKLRRTRETAKFLIIKGSKPF